MENNECNICSGKPFDKVPCGAKDFTKSVIEINNPEHLVLFRKVIVPASLGDDTTIPPTVGKYYNVLLNYEANNKSYLYSSDGIPTLMNNGVTDYEEATNLPQINGVTLLGNKTSEDLHITGSSLKIDIDWTTQTWSGADSVEDIYDYFTNKGKVVFSDSADDGGEYGYEIIFMGYIPDEHKILGVVQFGNVVNDGEGHQEFDGTFTYGTIELYNQGRGVYAGSMEVQKALSVVPNTGLNFNYSDTLSGAPATSTTIGMVKPGAGLSVDINGTLSTDGAIIAFDTVADMQASDMIVAGSYAQTLGYYTKGDYGASTYAIVDDELTANGSTIIALDSGLFAVLNLDDRAIKAEQFGAKGDGTTDDTVALQSAINYSIAHECVLELNGDYLVEPTQRDDNTYVCLTYEKRNTGMQYVGAAIKFNRSARIKTDYADDCTLLRIEARNILISDGYFSGVQGKTDLMEFSRINKLSASYDGWNMDNIIENCIFRYGKNAIAMEGNCYYNKFTNCRILNCYNGILMQMTAREKAGLAAESNVNRNDFVNVNMNLITNWGIRIEYGDTNKFVNVDLEGCANGIYIDQPRDHAGDFAISPIWFCDSNSFVNVMMEAITTLEWYNRSPATRIIATSADWGNKAQMVELPQIYTGGLNGNESNERILNMTFVKETRLFPSQVGWSIDCQRPFTLRGGSIYDTAIVNDDMVNKYRQGFSFVLDHAGSNIDSGTQKVYAKSLGGIITVAGSINIVPTDETKAIVLYFDDAKSWIKPKDTIYGNNTVYVPMVPLQGYVGGTLTTLNARIYSGYIIIDKPTGNWNTSSNTICFSNTWFSGDVSL